MEEFQRLETFMRLLHAVERVKRVARRPDENEMTNTAEHSFELAMLCWYIIATNKLDLDLSKVLQFALVHDLVEAYAGDTFPYNNEEGRRTKEAREHTALEKITDDHPEFPELAETIRQYDEHISPEARFVYAADKLVDPLSMSMEKTQSIWKDFNVSWKSLMDHKNDRIALSEHIIPYWKEVVKRLEAKKDFFFHS